MKSKVPLWLRITFATLLSLNIATATLVYKKQPEEIILENAKNNQTIMFTDMHEKDNLPFHGDSDYVISLLPKLKKLGFNYLAVEILRSEQPIIDEYINGNIDEKTLETKISNLNLLCGSKMIKVAKNLDMKVCAIDERVDYIKPNAAIEDCLDKYLSRDPKLYRNILKIFNKDKNAKVVVFIGGVHINKEQISEQGIPLGFFLTKYTKKKNYAVSLVGNQSWVTEVDYKINLKK